MKKKINLYHFTDKEIKGKIQVKYFGNNSFTFNDKKSSSIKRSFFYTIKNPSEYLLQNTRYCYICKVKKSAIYDITEDKKRLYNGDITDLLRKVKKLKYKGVKYNVGYEIISLLYDISICKKERGELKWLC